MKRTLLAVMLLVGIVGAGFGSIDVHRALASGNPFDWIWTLNDENGDPYAYPMPDSSNPDEARVLMYKPGSHRPELLQMNGGLQVDPSTNRLSVMDVPESVITNLVSDLSTLTTGLAGKAAASHSHSTSDITGLATFVDTRIGTSTQADWNQGSTTLPSFIKNKPTIPTVNPMTFGTSTRSLNTAFRVSPVSASFVSYTVDIGATLSLLAGDTGTVVLEYADDSGFTTNVKTVQSVANGNTGTLTVGLNLTQTATASLTGMIPAGKYVRLRTVNTTGTPTFTYRAQQEVLLPSN